MLDYFLKLGINPLNFRFIRYKAIDNNQYFCASILKNLKLFSKKQLLPSFHIKNILINAT